MPFGKVSNLEEMAKLAFMTAERVPDGKKERWEGRKGARPTRSAFAGHTHTHGGRGVGHCRWVFLLVD